MAAGVDHPRQQLVFLPVARHDRFFHLRQIGMVARGEIERLAVGRQHDAVRSVFAAARHLPQQFYFVELVVTVGVAQPVQSRLELLSTVDHRVEAVERVTQSVCQAHVDVELFDLGGLLLIANRRHGDAVERAILI